METVRPTEQRVGHALRARVLSPQAVTILIGASFVSGQYIPLKFIADLDDNSPLNIRIALRNDLKDLEERTKLVKLQSRAGTKIEMPPAMTTGAYQETMVRVSPRVGDTVIGKCMAQCRFGRSHILPTACSTSTREVIMGITNAYAGVVQRYDPIPQEHLPHFEALTTRFADVYCKYMVNTIAVYGSVRDDHDACLFLIRALLMLSYAHLCGKNWDKGLKCALRAKHVALNTALQPPGASTSNWNHDIDVYKEELLGTELDWIECLRGYARAHQHPREHIEQDLEKCSRGRDYWEASRKEGTNEAEDVNEAFLERWARNMDENPYDAMMGDTTTM